MAMILLFVPDDATRAALTTTLRFRGHVVREAGSWRSATMDSAESLFTPEIILCDVTDLRDAEWKAFRRFYERWRQFSSPILTLCWSRIWRGPQFVLTIERLGARFVYAE